MTLLFRYFAALALAAALLILAILPIFGWSAGVPMSYLTRDPAQLGSLPAYAGVLSNLGVLAWAGGFFVAAFTAAQLDVRPVLPEAAAYMQAVALLTMLLCADDFFLLHESLPIPEELFFGAYALLFGGILLRFRRVIMASPYRYALVGVVMLAGSVVVDLFQDRVELLLGDYRILLEDGAKFLGAVMWLGYIWRSALLFTGQAPAE